MGVNRSFKMIPFCFVIKGNLYTHDPGHKPLSNPILAVLEMSASMDKQQWKKKC
jgi:hypothetical protein